MAAGASSEAVMTRSANYLPDVGVHKPGGQAALSESLRDVRSERRKSNFRFYDRLSLNFTWPRADYDEYVAEMFWPFVRRVQAGPADFGIYVSERIIPDQFLQQFGTTEIRLYNPHDRELPDYNVGIRILGVPGVDRVVLNPGTGGQFVIVGNDIYVLNKDRQWAKKDLWRVIKQLILADFEQEHWKILHASAVRVGSGAVAFVGQRGSGKTTMMLTAIRRSAKFLTNDILITENDPEGVTYVRGWPDPIRIIGDVRTREKMDITVMRYFDGDRNSVEAGRIPLTAIVLPEIGNGSRAAHRSPRVREVEAGHALDIFQKQTFPDSAKWMGYEAKRQKPKGLRVPKCRYFLLTYTYDDATRAVDELFRLL